MTDKNTPESHSTAIPIYFKLHVSPVAVDQVVKDVQAHIPPELAGDVELADVQKNENNPSLYSLIYCVHARPNKQTHSLLVGRFLSQIFSQFTDKYPTYCEAVVRSTQKA